MVHPYDTDQMVLCTVDFGKRWTPPWELASPPAPVDKNKWFHSFVQWERSMLVPVIIHGHDGSQCLIENTQKEKQSDAVAQPCLRTCPAEFSTEKQQKKCSRDVANCKGR